MQVRDRASLFVRRTWWAIALALLAHAALVAWSFVSLEVMRAPSFVRTLDPTRRFVVSGEREGYCDERWFDTVIWLNAPVFFTGWALRGADVDPRPWWPSWAPRERFAASGDPEVLVGVGWPIVFCWLGARDPLPSGGGAANWLSWDVLPGRAIASVALLSLALLAVVRLAVMARRQLRKRRGCCQRCGYQLAGTPTQCPECGRTSGDAVPALPTARSVVAIFAVALFAHALTLGIALQSWPSDDIGSRAGPRGQLSLGNGTHAYAFARCCSGVLVADAVVRTFSREPVSGQVEGPRSLTLPRWAHTPIADETPRVVESRGVGLPVWFRISERYELVLRDGPLSANPTRPPPADITTDWQIYPFALLVSLALWTILLTVIWLVLRDCAASPS